MSGLTFSLLLWLSATPRPPACDQALERAVGARLSSAEGPWLLQCVDDDTLEVVRAVEGSEARARVVSLAGVSAPLRVEVAVLATRALLRASPEPAAVPAPVTEASAPPPPRTPVSPHLEVVVVPRTEAAPLRAGLLQPRGAPAEVTPRVEALGRWFPVEGTWLAGGAGGVEWGPVRVTVEASGAGQPAAELQVQALVLDAAGSLALLCGGSPSVAACARARVAAGAATLWSSSQTTTTRAGWVPWVEGGLDLELAARVAALTFSVEVTAGAAVGPRAIVTDVQSSAWAGLVLGASVGVQWN